MTRKRTPTPPAPPTKPYCPKLGELVLDRQTGNLGAYMDEQGGQAYLRPPKGGTEWSTDPANLDPVGDEPQRSTSTPPTSTPGRPRC